ncbi:MAG: hypothetical protein QOF60_1329 [Actinomycetota bacterium]|nr:hypothetical protein [Actinomycetota bacterium]
MKPWLRRLAWVSLVAAVLPIVVATVRAIASDWFPIGDNAFFAIRSRDVLTHHHPLLGTWTSASVTLGRQLNNPGPLQFDLLAAPAKVNGAAGLAVGVALVNIACVIGIAVVARRRGGPLVMAGAMAMAAALVWTMGSELLFDPWQPHALLLPFLFFVLLAWAMVAGELAALPWAVGVASFIVQTHLSYVVLVAAVGGAAALVLAVRAWSVQRRSLVRALVVSAVVAAVCWSQPVAEQLRHGGDGNLAALAAGGQGGRPVGLSMATRLTAAVVSLPPFWSRPSLEKTFSFLGFAHLPSLGAAASSLAVVLALLALCGWRNRRAGDGLAGAVVFVAAVALVGAVATATLLPLNGFGIGIAPHQIRWLWPVALVVWFAIALTAVRAIAVRTGPAAPLAAFVAVAVVFSGLALPKRNHHAGPSADEASIPTARRLVAGLGSLEGKGPFVFDNADLRFAEPYSVTVLAGLQSRGIEFRVADLGLVHQLGPSRAVRAGERVAGRLFLREGDAALRPQPGRVVSRVVGLDPRHHAEMLRLRDELSTYVTDHGLRLNRRGEDAVAVRALANVPGGGLVIHDFDRVDGDDLAIIVRNRLSDIDRGWIARFRRYTDLRTAWDTRTVALFVETP